MIDTDRLEMLKEINEMLDIELKQPGDVTIQELGEYWGITDSSVKSRMAKLIEKKEYRTLTVYDPEAGRRRRVYRKLEEEEPEQECPGCMEYRKD